MDDSPTLYPIGDEESASEAVVTAVAGHLETDEVELSPPLYRKIECDALDSLTESDGIRVEFHYEDCLVRIQNQSAVEVVDEASD